jgi:hypothetical protein
MADLAKVETELSKWITGKVVARKTDDFGTTVVVTKSDDGYTVLRAFPLGQDAGVSCDLQNGTADETIARLMRQAAGW